VKTICDAGLGFGGTWNLDGVIIFAPTDHDGLFQVAAAGGTPSTLTSLQNGEGYHRSPSFLADGNRFLYFAYPDAVYLGSLDGRAPKRVLTTEKWLSCLTIHPLFAERYAVGAEVRRASSRARRRPVLHW
jgi:hypothetical protein